MEDDVQFVSARKMGPDEFARWVEQRPSSDVNHYELLEGRVVMTPPAGYPHGRIGNKLQVLLGTFVDAKRLGIVFDSSQGFRLTSGDIVEPDHSFVSNERWQAMGAPVHGAFLRVVPDLVVEVLSASTRARDRRQKKRIYERNGVREYWLVDARAGEISVFVLTGGGYDKGRLHRRGDRVRSEILAGLEEDAATLVAGGQEGVPSDA